jgi:protein tyrosine phosphatase (PTP) superfamily phosphohydrolase (DUF442 family)
MRALVLVAALASGCAGLVPTPPPPPSWGGVRLARFDRVDDKVYRSAQPTRATLAEVVAREGIRTVVKLNRGVDPPLPGVRIVHFPLDPLVEPPLSRLTEILDAIEHAEGKVLVHCTHGEDRTGLIVALWRLRRGTPVDAAYADMVRHGFHPYPGVYRAWLRASGWDAPPGVR